MLISVISLHNDRVGKNTWSDIFITGSDFGGIYNEFKQETTDQLPLHKTLTIVIIQLLHLICKKKMV